MFLEYDNDPEQVVRWTFFSAIIVSRRAHPSMAASQTLAEPERERSTEWARTGFSGTREKRQETTSAQGSESEAR